MVLIVTIGHLPTEALIRKGRALFRPVATSCPTAFLVMGDDDIESLHIPDDWATAGEGDDDGSRSRSGWYTGGAISNCSARRGHLPDSESCHSATRGDWRIPHAGAGTGHSQRQPGPAFGATSKRDPPVQAHLSSVPATPEWSGAGTGDVPYQGPGSAHIRDRCANPSAAWVMWITASDHITMWIAMSYRPHLHGLMTALEFQQAAFAEPAGQQRRTYRRQRATQPALYVRCGRSAVRRPHPRSGETILFGWWPAA